MLFPACSSFPEHSPSYHDDPEPVDNLHKGHEAEPQEQAEQSSQRGDEVDYGHLLTPLVLCMQQFCITDNKKQTSYRRQLNPRRIY